MTMTLELSTFKQTLQESELPVLVDFYSPWCGPCQLMSQVLQQVKAQMRDRVRVLKVNTDEYREIAKEQEIYALPTLILFKQGQPVDRIEGLVSTTDLVEHLKAIL
jgi:thioredoxin